MKQSNKMFGIICCFFFHPLFANNATYIAKSDKANDTCYITAKITSLTDNTGKITPGVMFRAFSPDGDRLDVHCSNFVVKLKHNNEAFISNLTAEDLTLCQFNQHPPEAGADSEDSLITSGQFSLVELPGKPNRS